jgi:hypothetical protein
VAKHSVSRTGETAASSPCYKQEHGVRERYSPTAVVVGMAYFPKKGTEMARPQTPFTAKPAKQHNTSRDKMRMGYDRMRRDIKRTEIEQAKAAAIQAAQRRRK